MKRFVLACGVVVACAIMFTMTSSAQAQCYGGGYGGGYTSGYGGHFHGGYTTGYRAPVVYRQSYRPVVRSYGVGYGYGNIHPGHIHNNFRGYNSGYRGYNRGGLTIGIGF